MQINALVTCTQKNENISNTQLVFNALYKEGENTWSEYTPSLKLEMSVKKEVAEKFEVGQRYDLAFTPRVED